MPFTDRFLVWGARGNRSCALPARARGCPRLTRVRHLKAVEVGHIRLRLCEIEIDCAKIPIGLFIAPGWRGRTNRSLPPCLLFSPFFIANPPLTPPPPPSRTTSSHRPI